MKKLSIVCLLAATVLSATTMVNAQQVQRCHTDEHFHDLAQDDPAVIAQKEKVKKQVRQYLENPTHQNQRVGIITIPTVVHVMHNGENVGVGANISDAQIMSQMDVLNEDFTATNPDIVDVPAHFASVLGFPQIEFCLATVDPLGNSTNGIDRVNMGGDSWSDAMKPSSIWDSKDYLNIWVTDIGGGTLGYATFPGLNASRDGVVIHYKYFGSKPENPYNSPFDLGRTTTHEIGHWLGLDHTFNGGCSGASSTDCATSGDDICDTPQPDGPNYGCPGNNTFKSCVQSSEPDMWMNYMDYSDDACLIMFTEGQKNVMYAILNTIRADIKDSEGCGTQQLVNYGGKVVDAVTGNPIADAHVTFANELNEFAATTDANGNFFVADMKTGVFGVYAGKWGYQTAEFSSKYIVDVASTPTITIPLEKGYYDDFIFDLGWKVTGDATTGVWERGEPLATILNGFGISNPDVDVTTDYGFSCYATGNGSTGSGGDDVDDGKTVLTSPVFDPTGLNEARLSYYYWFVNAGGTTTPNDQLKISITNGFDTKVIEAVTSDSILGAWVSRDVLISDVIGITSTMQFMVETSDAVSTGHIVEAGLDEFKVYDGNPPVNTGIVDLTDLVNYTIYPNPSTGQFTIDLHASGLEELDIQVFNAVGKQVYATSISNVSNEQLQIDLNQYSEGIYFVRLIANEGSITDRVSVIR